MTERMALREDAAALLEELGSTADEVAASLAWMGPLLRPCDSRGPTTATSTATSRYLQAVIGADSRVTRVTLTKGWMSIRMRGWWRSTLWLRLPDPVRDFVASVEPGRSAAA